MQPEISVLKRPLYNAFKDFLNDELYSQTGNKKYRIFLYIALFGCIHVNDLYVLFPAEASFVSKKSNNELINIWGTRLNYLSYKKNGLEKLKQAGYYTLNSDGIHILYEHLQFKGYFLEVSFKQFYDIVKVNKSFVSHSSKSGRVSVNYVRSYDHTFYCEPLFDSSGKISLCNPAELKGAFFSPDTYYYDKKHSENIFIEADSSLENINTQIREKLVKYSNYFLKNQSKCMNTTIHFSVWNDKEKDHPFLEDNGTLNDIITLYELVAGSHKNDFCFNDFLTYVKDYEGSHEQAIQISLLLRNNNYSNISSFEDLRHLMFEDKMKIIYGSKFLLRRKNLLNLFVRTESLHEKLLLGLRFICTPLNSHDYSFKYIYIENEYKNLNWAPILSHFSIKGNFITYHKSKEFINNRTGDTIIFRNVFLFKNNTKFFHIIIENIVDDLGGIIRVDYYNKKTFLEFEEEIYIIGLYNKNISSDFYEGICKYPKENISILDYNDFIKLSSG